MKTFPWALLLALILAGPGVALASGEHWVDDFDKAAAQAKKEGKDLLVDFTGSDWCGWCIRLNKEVFDHESFWKPVMEKYVLLALDFPRGEEAKAKVPDAARNEELRQKYGVQGFPSILLMTADGQVYGRTGYQPGGPEKYVAHLDDLRKSGRKQLAEVEKLVGDCESAEGEAKAAALDRALAHLCGMEPDAAGRTALGDLARKTMEDESAPLARRLTAAKGILRSGLGNKETVDFARENDPENEYGAYEFVILIDVANMARSQDPNQIAPAYAKIQKLDELGMHDPIVKRQLYFIAAMWASRNLNQPEAARKYAKAALDVGVVNPRWKAELEKIANG